MSSQNVRVFVRFRPVNSREKSEGGGEERCPVKFDKTGMGVEMTDSKGSHPFGFDWVFPMNTRQDDVFDKIAKDTVLDVLKGYNGTIFAYGQTGAGKTFTMFGASLTDTESPNSGIIPRTARFLFDALMNDEDGADPYKVGLKDIEEITIKASFLEIYREIIRDLLAPSDVPLKIRQNRDGATYVENLTEEYITCESDLFDLIKLGEKSRSVAATMMNATSSRSHTLIQLKVVQKFKNGATRQGKLNFADLAGSEKIKKTGASGTLLLEAQKINKSLSALGLCINALAKGGKGHVPFRDSKLTFILKDSLGGNTKTTLIAACSPHEWNAEETVGTLRFAARAKTIQNKVKVNQQRSVEELTQMVRVLEEKLAKAKKSMSKWKKAATGGGAMPAGDDDDDDDEDDQEDDEATLEEKTAKEVQLQDAQLRVDELEDEAAQVEAKLQELNAELAEAHKARLQLRVNVLSALRSMRKSARKGLSVSAQLSSLMNEVDPDKDVLSPEEYEAERLEEEAAAKAAAAHEGAGDDTTMSEDSVKVTRVSEALDALATPGKTLLHVDFAGVTVDSDENIRELLKVVQKQYSTLKNLLDETQADAQQLQEAAQSQKKQIAELQTSLELVRMRSKLNTGRAVRAKVAKPLSRFGLGGSGSSGLRSSIFGSPTSEAGTGLSVSADSELSIAGDGEDRPLLKGKLEEKKFGFSTGPSNWTTKDMVLYASRIVRTDARGALATLQLLRSSRVTWEDPPPSAAEGAASDAAAGKNDDDVDDDDDPVKVFKVLGSGREMVVRAPESIAEQWVGAIQDAIARLASTPRHRSRLSSNADDKQPGSPLSFGHESGAAREHKRKISTGHRPAAMLVGGRTRGRLSGNVNLGSLVGKRSSMAAVDEDAK